MPIRPLKICTRLFSKRSTGPEEHLYSFDIGGTQVSSPDCELDDDELDASETKLEEISFEVGDGFGYLFDFGDEWQHDIELLEIVDSALLIAYGVMEDGHRRVLGVSVEMSEAEAHWRHFLESLVERGLHGLKMITSDNHPGLKNARKSVFPSVPWQRCQFHLQQNASAHVPKKSMQGEVHDDIRNIFNMPSKTEAEELLKRTIDKYKNKFFELAQWLENDLPEGFTVFTVVQSLNARRKLRTTNMVEFQNKELKKRTRCIRVFPNRESLLRIASALLIELDESWLAEDKVYIGS